MRHKRLDAVRCQGITNSGERCKKRGRFPKGYCPVHVSQAKKLGLGGYATVAGAAAATVTVIEKIVELLPYFMGHVPHHGRFQKDARALLEDGRFRELDRLLIKQSRSAPRQIQEKMRRLLTQFHASLPHLDRLNENKQRELGREISRRLDENDAG